MGWIGFNREQVRRLWGNYNLTALGLIHFRSLGYCGCPCQVTGVVCSSAYVCSVKLVWSIRPDRPTKLLSNYH